MQNPHKKDVQTNFTKSNQLERVQDAEDTQQQRQLHLLIKCFKFAQWKQVRAYKENETLVCEKEN